MPQSLGLAPGWTDLPVTMTNTGNSTLFNNASWTNAGSWSGDRITGPTVRYGWCYRDYWYPYFYPITQTITVEREVRPIKLSMSEVERLRVAAKKDKDLKATLEKFTAHIEVVVDFA